MKAEILEKAKKLLPEGQDEEKLSIWAEDVERYICAFSGGMRDSGGPDAGGGDGRERGRRDAEIHHKGGFQRILRAGAESGAFRF